MAISYIAGTKAPSSYPVSSNNTDTCILTKPSGTTTDDFLIAFLQAGGVTFTPPAGWSLLSNFQHSSGSFNQSVYYKRAESVPVRVMSFNIHHGEYPDINVLSLSAVRDIISDSGADIIGLQEVDKNRSRSDNVDQAAWLASELGFYYAFATAIDYGGGEAYGHAILSRWPIDSSTVTALSPNGGETRALLEADITVHGVAMTFANTHLDHTSSSSRQIQVNEIQTQIGASPTLTVFTGDMNAEPNSTEMVDLISDYQDTWVVRGVGNGYTFPGNALTKRIDYVLATDEIEVRAVEVVTDVATQDHFPYMADLYVPSGAEPANYTFTASANTTPFCGAVACFRGVDPLDHFAGTHQVSSTNGTDTVSTPSITTSATSLLLYFRSSRESDGSGSTITSEPTFATTGLTTRLNGGNRGASTAYGQRMVTDSVTPVPAGTHSGASFDANDIITQSIERTIALKAENGDITGSSGSVSPTTAANKPNTSVSPRAQGIG